MEIITNLEDIKKILIGENFIFGTHGCEPIEWQKIDEYLAISEKVLDCVVFDTNSNLLYDKSTLRKWCNEILSKSLALADDKIYILSYDEMLRYFPSDESRHAKPTEYAIMHGVYVSEGSGWQENSPYWTSSPYLGRSTFVSSTGIFHEKSTDCSYIGVRPALKLD